MLGWPVLVLVTAFRSSLACLVDALRKAVQDYIHCAESLVGLINWKPSQLTTELGARQFALDTWSGSAELEPFFGDKHSFHNPDTQ